MSRRSYTSDQNELEMLTSGHGSDSTPHNSHEQKSKRRGTHAVRHYHWKNPTLMSISLLAGIALALIHHFFYEHWSGKAVQSDAQQRWIIRAGTAFAFCFRTSLSVAASTAFVQHMWLCLQSGPHKICQVDSMFAMLSSVPALFNLKLWARLPVLLFMALIYWLLPLAAIIPPGTLIVTSVPRTTFMSQIVPQLDLRNKLDAFGIFQVDGSLTTFTNPTPDLVRLSLASASSSSILSITPPQPNSSYSLDFSAPALSCLPASDSAAESFKTQLLNYTDAVNGALAINYFSWTPESDNQYIDNPIPFNTTQFQSYDSSSVANRAPMLFVWAGPDNVTYLHTGALIGCTLKNASYVVDFRFEGTRQTLGIKRGEDLFEVIPGAINHTDPANIIDAEYNSTIPYQSIMSAFGTIMTGEVEIGFDDPAAGAEPTTLSTLVQSTGLGALLYSSDNATLAHAIEEMFQNITFSLMSNSEFTVDALSTTVAPTNVTVTNPQNIYTYQPFDLVLSYGIAILGAVTCIAIGALAMTKNGLSYTNDFATILRTTRSEDLNDLVQDEEANGADPLPAHVADGEVRYRPFSSTEWAGFHR